MMQQPASPSENLPNGAAPDAADRSHCRRRMARRRSHAERPELRLTSMVDVIFLLLVFFVITASFIDDEGTLLATLPGNTRPEPPSPTPEPTAVLIELASADDGVTYTLRANGRAIDGVTDLHAYLVHRQTAGMHRDDPVEIKPQGTVRWQHVVNVFNACVRADLESVGFAPS